MKELLQKKYFGPFIYFLVSFLFLLMEFINDRFWLSDFEVYYHAAERLLQGVSLYRYFEDGHYVFKYSPVSALLFVPFTLFGLTAAKLIYWILLTSAMVVGYLTLIRIAEYDGNGRDVRSRNILFLLIIPVTAVHFLRELHLGQVNQLLMVFYIIVLLMIVKGRDLAAGFLIGLTFFIKPFSLIFIPYLIVKRKVRALLAFLISLMLLVLPTLFLFGTLDLTISQYHSWLNELQIELGSKRDLLEKGNLTIFSVIARVLPFGSPENNVPGFQFAVMAILMIGMYVFMRIGATRVSQPEMLDFALLISFIPLISYTSQNAFIFASVLIVVTLYHWGTLRMVTRIITLVGLIFIGSNFAELIGKSASVFMDDYAFVSIGTILLITAAVNMRIRGIA